MTIEILQTLWLILSLFVLHTVPLTIQSFTQDLAILTTEITAIVIAIAALSYTIGVALMSNPVVHFAPSLQEHGVRLKNDSIKALFHIGIYAGIANIVTWAVALLNGIG